MKSDQDERFQLAAHATQRIVHQCRVHVERTVARLPTWLAAASASSAYGADRSAANEGRHRLALEWRVNHAETASNAILSHLRGLDVLLQQDMFLALPAMTIVRSITEVAASTSWTLSSEVDADERAARGYAGLFRTLEKSITGSLEVDAERQRELRETIIRKLEDDSVRIVRRISKNGPTDEVAQVVVGRRHAKPGFQYTRRVMEEIPSVGETYSGMSGVAHGEQMHLSTSWLIPDTYARLIGIVVQESVQAWSAAVHTWVGAEASPFVNPVERQRLLRSIPAKYRARFEQDAGNTA